ncbi:uncharacterized protein LOC135499493 isoform X2 [Lineus longissimus]|uniref:uncharacterized protein LOC135499493 isoform X2 n=1 Tax=Lineus longissimus TaxID=88925 RepID=UPI002B4E466C
MFGSITMTESECSTETKHFGYFRQRPKGLPELGQQHAMADGPPLGQPVPYRLPKVPSLRNVGDTPRQLYSRQAFPTARSLNELSVDSISLPPPKTYVQERRRANLAVPKFKRAMIAPINDRTCGAHFANNLQRDHESSWYQRYERLRLSVEGDDEPEVYGPLPTPHRSPSPTKSVNWTLSPHRNASFDRKGKSHVQGPFSREFTVTCSAPTNWLRMKLGRSKTTLV